VPDDRNSLSSMTEHSRPDSIITPSSPNGHKESSVGSIRIHVTCSWKALCNIAISLPLGALFTCLISAYIIHPADKIQERSCQIGEQEDEKVEVFNIVPSISSIIGIYPQCYIWRLVTAFHLGPRCILPFVYYRYYMSHLGNVPIEKRSLFKVLSVAVTICAVIETIAFTLIAYISNRDNYPVHEKSFCTYLLSSTLYMIITLFLYPMAKPHPTPQEVTSLRLKKIFFSVLFVMMFIMFYFYYLHMQYCLPLAFSTFALSEYVISIMNMMFHYTLNLDFGEDFLIVGSIGKPVPTTNGRIKVENGATPLNKNNKTKEN